MKKAYLLLILLFGLPACGSAQFITTITPPPTSTVTETFTPTTTSTHTHTATRTPLPRQVELVFARDDIIVPDSCKVVPEATVDNTLTLDGKAVLGGTVIDSYIPLTDGSKQSILLIAARPVSIEKIYSKELGHELIDVYLLCYSVNLPSGDNIIIASDFFNTSTPGFSVRYLFRLPGSDIADVTLDQTVDSPTPMISISNSDFLELFLSGKIIGHQVLLNFPYDYQSSISSSVDNPKLAAIVSAFKDNRLPAPVHVQLHNVNTIGANLVVPAELVP